MSIQSFLVIMLSVVITFSSAYGIGRSGNGTISSGSQGFFADTPHGFEVARALPGDRLQLFTQSIYTGPNGLQSLFVDLSSAKYSLPLLADLNRNDLAETMKNEGWISLSHKDTCISAYFKPESMALAAFWGGGKGLVIVGPASNPVEYAEKFLLDSLRLSPGACAWK